MGRSLLHCPTPVSRDFQFPSSNCRQQHDQLTQGDASQRLQSHDCPLPYIQKRRIPQLNPFRCYLPRKVIHCGPSRTRKTGGGTKRRESLGGEESGGHAEHAAPVSLPIAVFSAPITLFGHPCYHVVAQYIKMRRRADPENLIRNHFFEFSCSCSSSIYLFSKLCQFFRIQLHFQYVHINSLFPLLPEHISNMLQTRLCPPNESRLHGM